MKEVKWTDDLSVGIDLIDWQHKTLIERLDNLTQAVERHRGPEQVLEMLAFLVEYADFHFSAEEGHMEANEYPGFAAHKEKHAEFKASLKKLENDFNEEGSTFALAKSVDNMLVHWLFEHIKTVDVEFGDFLRDKGVTLED